MLLGVTYSHRHAAWMKLNPFDTLDALLQMQFDMIRLCCYWNEIQPFPEVYDFSYITSLLRTCEQAHQKVVLCIGMKSPRWPEFYVPSYTPFSMHEDLFTTTRSFLTHALEKLTSFSCITHWQIENEPLDPTWPSGLAIPEAFLQQEVELVRQKDTRPIIVTMWGNSLTNRNILHIIEPFTDVAGIDLYYKQYHDGGYIGPEDSDAVIKQTMTSYTKPVWITELQAEPWEADSEGYFAKQPKSMNIHILQDNFARARKLHPAAILFWGCEYWIWKQMQGDSSYCKAITSIMTHHRVSA